MQLTNLAIKRALIVLIGVAALLAFGLLSVTKLGVQLLPTMDVPVVNITTVYPGAGPDAHPVARHGQPGHSPGREANAFGRPLPGGAKQTR